jgi:HAD superfamily hydrolase (TIGR01490 family)
MPRVAAFFDMDRTLLRCNSGERWVKFLRRRGEISLTSTLRALGWLLLYRFSLLDFQRVAEQVVAELAGQSEEEMIAKCHPWVMGELLPEVAPAARRALEEHRAQGHEVTILSTSTPYVTRPLAQAIGLDPDKVLCTRLEVAGGRFTGGLITPVCYGEGKVRWAERFAREHDVDLDRSWFYSDSFSDLPMLERAGHRVVVNPDPRLWRHASQRGWRIESW